MPQMGMTMIVGGMGANDQGFSSMGGMSSTSSFSSSSSFSTGGH